MSATRALLIAVFGGFIGAAPGAPVLVATGSDGGYRDHRAEAQKRERPAYEAPSPSAAVAAAPPSAGGADAPSSAVLPASTAGYLPAGNPVGVASIRLRRPPAPSADDVRAGLLDLPPPVR
jgi:hypothetical protein